MPSGPDSRCRLHFLVAAHRDQGQSEQVARHQVFQPLLARPSAAAARGRRCSTSRASSSSDFLPSRIARPALAVPAGVARRRRGAASAPSSIIFSATSSARAHRSIAPAWAAEQVLRVDRLAAHLGVEVQPAGGEAAAAQRRGTARAPSAAGCWGTGRCPSRACSSPRFMSMRAEDARAPARARSRARSVWPASSAWFCSMLTLTSFSRP